jgi:hypothetical protein
MRSWWLLRWLVCGLRREVRWMLVGCVVGSTRVRMTVDATAALQWVQQPTTFHFGTNHHTNSNHTPHH